MKSNKYILKCNHCNETFDMSLSILDNQACPSCESKYLDVIYTDDLKNLADVVLGESPRKNNIKLKGMWKFHEYLPMQDLGETLRHENDISFKRFNFLESIAKNRFGIQCTVIGHRFDESISTGTWKDLSGAMLGKALAEHGVKNYVVASTGNIGVAMACYLTLNKINLYAFIPRSSSKAQAAEIASFNQTVIRVDGDYAHAKALAKEFAAKNNYIYSNGTFDIFRLEAKKTMAYEWRRNLDVFPTVYIQALSGGTGPLGVFKGCKELEAVHLIEKQPRQILIQTAKCAPMADSWSKAKKEGFPEGWYKEYYKIDNPMTAISTLSTGNPYAYPSIARMIHSVDGHITKMNEEMASNIAKLIAKSTSIRIGPAAAIGMGGFFKGLMEDQIRNGDIVMINVGEGMRRSPEFLESMLPKDIMISRLDELPKLGNENQEGFLEKLVDTILEEI